MGPPMPTSDGPTTNGKHSGEDRLLPALVDAVTALEDVSRGSERLVAQAQALVAARREGRAWEAILSEEESPRVSERLADCADAVGRVSSTVRRMQADVLYDSGMAMHRIGTLMGITRQRVAVLLKASADAKSAAVEESAAAQESRAVEESRAV